MWVKLYVLSGTKRRERKEEREQVTYLWVLSTCDALGIQHNSTFVSGSWSAKIQWLGESERIPGSECWAWGVSNLHWNRTCVLIADGQRNNMWILEVIKCSFRPDSQHLQLRKYDTRSMNPSARWPIDWVLLAEVLRFGPRELVWQRGWAQRCVECLPVGGWQA